MDIVVNLWQKGKFNIDESQIPGVDDACFNDVFDPMLIERPEKVINGSSISKHFRS